MMMDWKLKTSLLHAVCSLNAERMSSWRHLTNIKLLLVLSLVSA